jgi:hypothetical protein
MSEDYEYKIYGTSTVFLEEGQYTREDLLAMLRQFDLYEELNRKSMELVPKD